MRNILFYAFVWIIVAALRQYWESKHSWYATNQVNSAWPSILVVGAVITSDSWVVNRHTLYPWSRRVSWCRRDVVCVQLTRGGFYSLYHGRRQS